MAAPNTPPVLGKAWFDSTDLTVFLSKSQGLGQIGPVAAGVQIKSAMDVLSQSATWDFTFQSLVMSQWDVPPISAQCQERKENTVSCFELLNFHVALP